jgi:hypothetical protein
MNHFPLFEPLPSSKTAAISGTSAYFKQTFSGAMPFVRFISYQKGSFVIGNDSDYTSFVPGQMGWRFPPMVVGLEVKPGGSMGVLREGHITIKFPSMGAMEYHSEFFRIGTPKAIRWGWTKKRSSGADYSVPQGLDAPTAKTLVDNIDTWEKFCGDGTEDVMVGPLIDFSYTINNDASVDATFVVGTKNEIPAYLGTNRQDKKNTNSSTKDSVADNRLARVLELENGQFLGLKNDIAKKHTINYNFSNQGFFSALLSRIGTLFNPVIEYDHDAYSDDVFISMEFLVDYTINKGKGKQQNDYKLDISNAVAAAHPNIISNSENVIFPNATMANPIVAQNVDGATLVLDTKNTQNLKLQSGKEFPEQIASKGILKIYNGDRNNYEKGKWGYIKNIFLKVDFVLDVAKSMGENGKMGDFIQKLCDEINVAGAGLMELAPQVQSDSNGTMIYTIVDYALIPSVVAMPSTIHLFNDNTTITNINFSADLPKEIIAMAMLGNQKSKEIGKNLFFKFQQDPTDILNLKSYIPDASFANTGGFIPGTGFGNIPGINVNVPTQFPMSDGTTPRTPAAAAGGAAAGGTPPAGNIITGFNTAGPITPTNTLIDDNCIVIHSDDDIMTNGSPTKDVSAILKDTALCKNLYFGNSGLNKNNPLLPIELELTVLGISGITVGKVVNIDRVPFDKSGVFQVTEVTHKVSDTWETTIKFRYRPTNV